MAAVDILIPTYNRLPALIMTLAGVAAQAVDAVVLAQASMTRALPAIGDIGVPVLTSPTLGVRRVADVLGLSSDA